MRRRERKSPYVNAPIVMGVTTTLYKGVPFGTPTTHSYNPYTTRGAYESAGTCIDETHAGPPYRTGGPLIVVQWRDPFEVRGSGTYVGSATADISYRYVGGFIPSWKWSQFGSGFSNANFALETTNPGSMFPSNVDAEAYGATGWKRFRPGKPTADLGVFLGEIRDVPRMLKDTANFFNKTWRSLGGSTGKPSKALSNHWLSIQFGWLPFISDLRRFHRSYVELDRQIAHIKRNNGQWCKRGGSVVEDSTSVVLGSSAVASAHWPSLVSYLYASPAGSYTVSKVTTTRVWFEGSFRYWIPNIESVWWRKRAIAELYGAMPNPALVWELTPFSWLVDWVSNVGDVVANMDSGWADNLAAKYAYVMKSVDVTGVLESFCNLRSAKLHDSWTFPISWKSRAGASRFGFGLTDANFSARQWSILAALGFQRYR